MLLIHFIFVMGVLSVQSEFPPIGLIEIYGVHTVPNAEIRNRLPIKTGDSLPADIGALMNELRTSISGLPNVKRTELNLTCCESGKTILYIGVADEIPKSMQYRPVPQGTIKLPSEIIDVVEARQRIFTEALLKGLATEDFSEGHSRLKDPSAREIEDSLIRYASRNVKTLRAALKNSADSRHRAMAAVILGYSSAKQAIVPDLIDAIRDPDSNVRNNAMRTLWVMATAEQLKKMKIKVPWAPFVVMLNSIVWTDRNKSSVALDALTHGRNPVLLAELGKNALGPLIEIATWRSGHAMAGFFILGRIGGLPETEIQAAWDRGDREFVISRARISQHHP
jgi:hypothetical protein